MDEQRQDRPADDPRAGPDRAAGHREEHRYGTSGFPVGMTGAGPGTAPFPAPQAFRDTAPQRRRGTGIVVAALIAGLVGGGGGFAGAYAVLGDGTATPTLTSAPTTSPAVDTTPGTVAGAAAIATPSSADIRVTTAQGTAEGSGVVLTPDGDVLTNNHVVSGSGGDITVTLADGTAYPARIVGSAPSYDLAVLRLDGASGLTPAAFGDSGALQVGQQVVAIGSPQGLSGTVTTGIVSALARTVAVQGQDGSAVVYNGLQTDAPINQGNSGGALVDLQGRVVGINSAIATTGESAGSIGLGFAIPVDQAKRVAQEILDDGIADKPVLGVQGAPATSDGSGARITGVQEGSAAAAAGIVAGDTVTEVGDARVRDFADLIARIGAATPGGSVPLTVVGAGGERTVEVTLGTAPDEAPTVAPRQSTPPQRSPFGGLTPFGR